MGAHGSLAVIRETGEGGEKLPPLFFGSDWTTGVRTRGHAAALLRLWMVELAQAGTAYPLRGTWHREALLQVRLCLERCYELRVLDFARYEGLDSLSYGGTD